MLLRSYRHLQSKFYRQFLVMTNERALLFYRGRLIRILRSGQVRVFDPFGNYSIEYFSLEPTRSQTTITQQKEPSKFRQRLIDVQKHSAKTGPQRQTALISA
jgi:hypothetical protein